METTTSQTTSQEAGPTLQLKRSLLPVDEYAARQGVSKGIVEECGKLGIVQIRKYKGKTFVVDVPLSPYLYTSETTKEPTQPIDKSVQVKKISELVQKVIPDNPRVAQQSTEPTEPLRAGTISQLVKKMFRKASEITNKPPEITGDETDRIENTPEQTQIAYSETPKSTNQPAQSTNDRNVSENILESIQITPPEPLEIVNKPTTAAEKITKTEHPHELIQTPELETLETADELTPPLSESAETEETPKSAPDSQHNGFQPSTLGPKVKSKHTWQVTAIFSLAFLSAAIFTNLLFYANWKIQLDQLNQTQTNIQKAYDDLAQANLRVEILQNQLDNSRAEVKSVRNELARAKQNLETIQKRNPEAAERLNERIQKLTTQLNELTTPPQAPPGSGM